RGFYRGAQRCRTPGSSREKRLGSVLNGSVWSGFGKHLNFVGKNESRASVPESNKVHMAAKIVDFLEDFDGFGKTYSSLVIPHLFQQAAVFAFWGDGGGGDRG